MTKHNTVNRIYKDRLFRFIFNNPKELLSLYNAVNNTCYKSPNDLIINTLEHVIYMGAKNDLSFLIYGILKCRFSLLQAVETAIDYCIQNHVLSDILLKHKSEVTNMLLEEYDEQTHIENEKRWSREEGRQEEAERINHLNCLLIEQGRTEDLFRSASDRIYQKQLLKEFNL